MANWYLEAGKEADVVMSTRIRLARNIADIPFTNRYTKEQAESILRKMEEIVPSIGYGLKMIRMKNCDDITKQSLVEKHMISPEFASKNQIEAKAIIVNEEENICIMIGEEDHLRLQVFHEGLDLESALALAIEIDEKLNAQLNYACHAEYGYLTACPTNVGTAMRASVMVHLPGLSLTGNIGKVLNVVGNFGMTIRGVYGEGSQSQGDIYQISNNQTLGVSEKEIIKNLKMMTEKVIGQERLARKALGSKALELEDAVYRAYGILTNARKLTSEECMKLVSEVKLGTDLGIIRELNDFKVKQLDLYTKPANLQKYVGEMLDAYRRDCRRAEVIQQIIHQKE